MGKLSPPVWLAPPATVLTGPVVSEKAVETHHQITINGRKLSYTATAGFLPLRNQFRQTKAEIFYVAYKLDTVADRSPRPLTFLWGGGPGSPASLLQLGGLGPERTQITEGLRGTPPSYHLVENENTWLAFTDMVFVDPVGTGYSYAPSPEDLNQFWNVQGDIDSVAEFIRAYLTHYHAWNAPLFILGESYGTLRAAGVAKDLATHHILLKGVILISPILNFQLTNFGPENDLPYVLALPSYTAAAYAHRKLPPDLQASFSGALGEAEKWATTDYTLALMKGNELSAQKCDDVAAQLARFTGLNRALILRNNLRITVDSFAGQLLAGDHQMVARYDTSLSYPTVSGPYDVTKDTSIRAMDLATRPLLDYFRFDLGFASDAYYEGPFGGAWPYASVPRADWTSIQWKFEPGVVDESTALALAMHIYPSLRVFVASGYFDLSTPFWEAEYTFDHMGLDVEQRKNVTLARYLGGHAMYLVDQVRPRLQQDVAAFIRATLSAPPTQAGENDHPLPGHSTP